VRIVLHDYTGHAFAVQLSRELARRGHEVLHLHCPSYASGKGDLRRGEADPETFSIDAVSLDGAFAKHSPLRRVWQEWVYGRRAAARIARFRPDVVLSSNTPLISQLLLQRASRRQGARFVFWQQDVISVAIERFAAAKLPGPLRLLARPFRLLEGRLLRRSDAVVPISEDFQPILAEWGVPAERVHVVHNWAPVAELPLRPRDNELARAHGLVGPTVFLYSGTLGLKHDPEHLVALARRFDGRPDVRVVVVSEGVGADYVRTRAAEEGLDVLVLPYQPHDAFPDVLGAADVLVAILEPDAGVYSVPSKILSYLCAGRPVLAAIPETNLAARLIASVGAGVVVPPGDLGGLAAAAERLLDGPARRAELGAAARAYAEATFDIERVAATFEAIFRGSPAAGYSHQAADASDPAITTGA
jgi:glycosyltransferase involved in cell wall biosynthesis